MNGKEFHEIERHMLSLMRDSAHDCQHVYRVLYAALEIAAFEKGPVDPDVLIAACLLHDVGREQQYRDPSVCHAQAGAVMALEYLRSLGWEPERASHVRDCIASHRFRSENPPASLEARILFDADKLDVTGAIGVARTLLYEGHEGIPLYRVEADGSVDGNPAGTEHSFFHEYHFKLKKLYGQFYTERARGMARERQEAAQAYYEALAREAQGIHASGTARLEAVLNGEGRTL